MEYAVGKYRGFHIQYDPATKLFFAKSGTRAILSSMPVYQFLGHLNTMATEPGNPNEIEYIIQALNQTRRVDEDETLSWYQREALQPDNPDGHFAEGETGGKLET